MEQTGGIAHGMSGSPVYINGKLVGAVAYGWGFADGTIGMITPIEDMVNYGIFHMRRIYLNLGMTRS